MMIVIRAIILESFCSYDYKTDVLRTQANFLIIQRVHQIRSCPLRINLLKHTSWTSLSKLYKFFN